MSRRRWVHATLAAALVPPLLVLGAASSSQAAPAKNGKFTLVQSLAPTSRVTAAKTPTSRLAKTDQSLLNHTDTAPVSVVVKLDYDSTSTYEGSIAGYAATSPSVTGKALSGSTAEQQYEGRIAGLENKFLGELAKRVPNVKVGQRLRTVFGGVALTVPANKVSQVLSIPGVVAVQKDAVNKPQTDASSDFIGATALYPQLGGKPNAGKGVIFGSLDTGAWPEHPSFADNGNLGAPPAKADGTPRACDFGDNPLTPAVDVFKCNNKLIGGKAFLATYQANNPPEVYKTARDSDGHGTHTASTAAGNPVDSAKIFGIERGPINGIAPGAWVSVYKVCGANGCYNSDSAAAVQQAIKDGVNVINFSISGGNTPFTDPVELAFLDAYAAGVFVSASAGNSGPGASTSAHLSAWVTTVAASTQKREFDSTLTVSSSDGTSATFTGSSLTQGAGPAPVVLGSAAPYSDILCSHPAPPNSLTGKIIVCQRGGSVNGVAIGRAQKGFNVSQGGAAGMILYNATLADTETDNHFLPAVHLADGTQFLAYVNAHPGITGQFTEGVKVNGKGDVMAAFSSRGPGGNFIKPDITAPGVQILAGNTPTPDAVPGGPPGQYYQAIAGTSMSSPHIAGSAILEKALHPGWTPGQVKSALMTTASTNVVKENLTTPADPFDFGAGRVQLNLAGNPGLTFDETAARMAALGNDPVNAVQLNIPSVDAPVMPGKLTAIRTAKNVTNQAQTYHAQTTAPSGGAITVTPSTFTLAPGRSISLKITISSSAPEGQYFGQVRLVPSRSSLPTLHLPVAFVTKQGDVKVTQSCDKPEVHLIESTTCTVTAQNETFDDTSADFTTTTTFNLPVVGANGATQANPYKVEKKGVALAGAIPATPSIAPATLHGYVPLDGFPDTLVAPIGDEEFVKFNVPAFTYNGTSYDAVSINSNGYLVPGGNATAEDDNCCTLTGIPDPARPNNVLAPFWTDLDGSGAPGLMVNILTDGTNDWTVVEWRVNVFGTSSQRVFQIWLGVGTVQDVSFSYNVSTITDPGQPFQVGAENINGTGGQGLPTGQLPTGDLRVTSTAAVPGGSTSYTVTPLGIFPGGGKVTTSVNSPLVPGTTIVTTPVAVLSTFNRWHNFN
jgi:hypothetical protein